MPWTSPPASARAPGGSGTAGSRTTGVLACLIGLLLIAGCGTPATSLPTALPSDRHAAHQAQGSPGTEGAAAAGSAADPAPSGSPHAGHGTDPLSGGQTSGKPTTAQDYQRLSAAVMAAFDKGGAAKGLRTLSRQVSRHPELSGVCHAVAHDLGHAALTAAHGSTSAAMDARNDVCGGGFIHGVVEAALAGSKHPKRDMLRICAPANTGTCWHGIGHGVMFSTGYRTHRAEQLCTRAPSARLVGRCAEGLYMQLFTLDEGGSHVAGAGFVAPTPANVPKTCARAGASFVDACWFYAPTVVLQARPEKWGHVLRWCAEQSTGQARSTCVRGVGSRLVKYHPDDIPFAARQCRKAGSGHLGACLAGMGSYWSVHWSGRQSRAAVCAKLRAPDLVGLCRAVNT